MISYIRKKRKWTLLKGDGMVTELFWMVTEMYLPFSRLNGDWKVTEWRLSVFTEWWRFVVCTVSPRHNTLVSYLHYLSPSQNTPVLPTLSLPVTILPCLTFTVSPRHNTHLSYLHCLSPSQNTCALSSLYLWFTKHICLSPSQHALLSYLHISTPNTIYCLSFTGSTDYNTHVSHLYFLYSSQHTLVLSLLFHSVITTFLDWVPILFYLTTYMKK